MTSGQTWVLQLLKLPTLAHRRRRGNMIKIYKYFQNPNNYINSLSLKLANTRTRGHNLKLMKQRVKTNLRLNFFHIQATKLTLD
jgi:hypothetical protein